MRALLVGSLAFLVACPAIQAFSSSQPFAFARAFKTERGAAIDTEGMIKTITTEGTGTPLRLGDIATIKYRCYLPGDEYKTQTPFSQSSKQKVVVGDSTMIPGWDKALRSMSVGERAIVRLSDPALAYGSSGVPPIVPPNAVVELDIQVMDAQPATTNIDFDSIALADNTPRTAKDIQAAFEARKASKSQEQQLEGLDAFLAKAKNFYFFGLFEGETGERPPWFLRPSITFPLVFVFVAALFYITFIGGGIYERGAPITDELDEMIISSILGGGNSVADPAQMMWLALSFLPASDIGL